MDHKSPKYKIGFRAAFRGIWITLKSELNMRIHAVATVLVVLGGWWFQLSTFEWIAVVGMIGIVIGVEMLNSAVEKLCDMVQPDFDDRIKWIKDVSAGAVLVVSMAALFVGVLVFLPKIVDFL